MKPGNAIRPGDDQERHRGHPDDRVDHADLHRPPMDEGERHDADEDRRHDHHSRPRESAQVDEFRVLRENDPRHQHAHREQADIFW